MTLTTQIIKDQFNGTGAQTAFPTTFVFWDADDLEVIHTDAGNVETIWVRGTQYNVTGGNGATGTVTVSTSPTDYTPASGTRLTIRSALPNTQPTSLPAGGPFPSVSVEQRFDQNVRLIQQLAEEVTRTIQLAVTSTSSGIVIPDPEASKFLRWDAAANNLENADITSGGAIGIPVTIAQGGTNAITAVAARTNLAVPGLADANTFTGINTNTAQVRWTKGADIVSASPLVLGTDGNYFNVAGTTGFAAITVVAGTFFMLQFDGALTLTHGGSLNLPGKADITTAQGDRLIGFATAANVVQVLSYSRASGTAVIEAGFPKGHLAGLELTKLAADTLAIAAGEARDATDTVDMTLSAFTKDVSLTWAVGTGSGGLGASATYAASSLYYVWLIRRSDTGAVDVLIDDDPAAPEYPTNYDQSRFIGYCFTDATSDLEEGLIVSAGFRVQEYVSPEQTITSAGLLTLAHGLGVVPKLVQFYLVCKTADAGYTAGDVALGTPIVAGSASQPRGTAVTVDAINIKVRFGSTATFCLHGPNFGTGAIANYTNSSWKLVVKAWA